MLDAISVPFLVAAIVGSYMFIVNLMLRTDANWGESNMVKPAAKSAAPLPEGLRASAARA